MDRLRTTTKKIVTNPLFIVGLTLKIFLILSVESYSAESWYIPFVMTFVENASVDPWGVFLSKGGDANAFPYGYVMLLVFAPAIALCSALGLDPYIGYSTTLLVVDICLAILLKIMLQVKDSLLLIGYWLSPVVIFATYWLGFNDLVPVAFLCLALYLLRSYYPFASGFLCGVAISAKLSMILPVPFIAIYLLRNRALTHLFLRYSLGLSVSLIVFCLPFMFSDSAMSMLFNNPEMTKTFDFALSIGSYTDLYILPMAYILMLYLSWQVRRITFELFYAIMSIAFLLVLVFTPAAPGWFVWFIPLVLAYLAKGKGVDHVLLIFFSSLYIVSVFLTARQPSILSSDIASTISGYAYAYVGIKGSNILNTGLLIVGLILALRIWQGAVTENDYFRLSRKPLVLGIAGDSGAGKDFLVDSLKDLFGGHSIVHLSGDDYHLWDRHKPMWQVLTHLNPRANDLERFTKDLLSLVDGKTIYARHYDHESGKMTLPYRKDSNDFILASGLHTLHLPILRDCFDLKMYLDIDEQLRKHFKIQRDVKVRGHSLERVLASIEKRESDSKKFIRPQAKRADIVFSVKPENPNLIDKVTDDQQLRLKLEVLTRNGFQEESLKRVLVGVCGLHVDVNAIGDHDDVIMSIEGDVTGEDIALAAKTLFPQMQDFLDMSPRWMDGVSGLMQLITLSHINQALSKRLL